MAPSPSSDHGLAAAEVGRLLDIADAAIVDGLVGRRPAVPAVEGLPAGLQQPRGVFVTLTVRSELNGCIGSIEGHEPIGVAAARHAWAAAFDDPRLPALRRRDYEELRIEVSVLSPLVPTAAADRERLLGAVRPGVDGLVVGSGPRRAVFLPAVWEQLPEPAAFLDHLMRKAGLLPDRWPDDMRAWRFTAAKHARSAGALPHRAA